MKFLKGIGLFFFYPLVMLVIGFYAGVKTSHFFYPGGYGQEAPGREGLGSGGTPESGASGEHGQSGAEDYQDYDYGLASKEAAASSETLSVETEYVLEETDVLRHTVVETSWRLPDKYVGMNREQFLVAMENYAAAPPLSEQERGFVGLEVLSFSRQRVVVQMNYRYVQPSESFYLGVYNNEVLVYLEDMETVYIETGIRLDTLPEDLQVQIIQMMLIEDEEKLYDFLEGYSS